MLKKFIIICLVISTFGYGVVWAFDGHLDVPQVQYNAGDNTAHDHHDGAACDHCCHISAHLLGIAMSVARGASINCNNIFPADPTTLISFLAIPASPPPKN